MPETPPDPDAALETPARLLPVPPPDERWVGVIEDAHRQAAEAHSAFLRLMAESHQAYLRVAEATLTGLLDAAAGRPPTPAQSQLPAGPSSGVPDLDEPEVAEPPAAAGGLSTMDEEDTGPAEEPNGEQKPSVEEPVAEETVAEETVVGEPAAAEVPAAAEPAAEEPGPEPTEEPDIEPLLLPLVAQRTGHPENLDTDPDHLGTHRTAPSSPSAGLSRRTLRPAVAARSGGPVPGLAAASLAVTDDGRGVAPLVVAGLRRKGLAAEVVSRIRPDAGGVILLDGLRRVPDVSSATTAQRNAFRAARAVAARMESAGGVFVTVQDTGGDFGLATPPDPARAWLGGLAALARTAAREWPRAAVRAIDCAAGGRPAVEIADAIVAELLGGGAAPEVGLRADGTRIEPATVDLTEDEDGADVGERTTRIGPDSVIVATGGARGVTAACLRLLAARRRPKLVLLGRTPLSAEPDGLAEATDEDALIALLARREPGSPAQVAARARRVLAVREIRATLAAIERDGGTARYVSIDVRDADALSWALDAVRRDWGPITALVHGAGVLAEARIGDKTDEQFGRVFDTKVEGLRALLAATADDPLDVLCAFSSTAAVYGSAGRADEAMAGGVLNQVLAAERHRRPRCLVRSIAWGPWAVGPANGDGIAPDAGARAFLDELDGSADGVLVVRAAADRAAAPEEPAAADMLAVS